MSCNDRSKVIKGVSEVALFSTQSHRAGNVKDPPCFAVRDRESIVKPQQKCLRLWRWWQRVRLRQTIFGQDFWWKLCFFVWLLVWHVKRNVLDRRCDCLWNSLRKSFRMSFSPNVCICVLVQAFNAVRSSFLAVYPVVPMPIRVVRTTKHDIFAFHIQENCWPTHARWKIPFLQKSCFSL